MKKHFAFTLILFVYLSANITFAKIEIGCSPSDSTSINKARLTNSVFHLGALVRMDTTEKKIYLAFTGGEYADGGEHIINVLDEKNVKANFFFTGGFYHNKDFKPLIERLVEDGHYLGPHSDKHLLYADWSNRDSTLVSRNEFEKDLRDNYKIMNEYGIAKKDAYVFMPPYEWYNNQISEWCEEMGVFLVNYTAGTRSNADYTTPDMDNYVSSDEILRSIFEYEKKSSNGMNGFILLIHIGTSPKRDDKLYHHLDEIIEKLLGRGYSFETLIKGLEE